MKSRSLPASPAVRCFRPGAWFARGFCLMLALALVVLFSAEADAQRRGRGRSGAAAAAARKKQMIAMLQKQLAVTKQVLSAAENQAQMSQGEVNEAISKLTELRTSLEVDEESAREAAKELNELEEEIIEKQSNGSEYKLTELGLATAKENLHEFLHKRFPKLPQHSVDVSEEAARLADLAVLSSETRKELEADEKYHEAAELVKSQGKKLAQIRQKLFEADSEWVDLRKELAEATKKIREEKTAAGTAGLGSLDDRQDLRKSQNLAATARGMIMQYEMQLARLGAKPAAPKTTTKSPGQK